MQRKQMMDLRVERRLCGVVVLTPCRWERRRRESEVWRRSLRIVWIQRIGDGKTRVVSIGGIKIVGDICKTVFEDSDFARQGFQSCFVALDAGLLLAEVGGHCRHCAAAFVVQDVDSFGSELAAYDCALA